MILWSVNRQVTEFETISEAWTFPTFIAFVSTLYSASPAKSECSCIHGTLNLTLPWYSSKYYTSTLGCLQKSCTQLLVVFTHTNNLHNIPLTVTVVNNHSNIVILRD